MYKLLFIIIALFVIMFSVTKCNEGFTNTTSTPSAVPITSDNVADYIYKIYKADVKAIQNLADIAMKLQAGGVTVPGKMIIQNGLDVTNDTKLNGKLDITSDTTLGGKLNINGATTLGSTLGVANDTKLNGKLDVNGATTLGSTLGVANDTKLNGKLDVNGATTLGSTLGVTNDTKLNGKLDVNDATTLKDTIVNGKLTMNNLATLTPTQVGSALVIDTNNNICKRPILYATWYSLDEDKDILFCYKSTMSQGFPEWKNNSTDWITTNTAMYKQNFISFSTTVPKYSTFTPKWESPIGHTPTGKIPINITFPCTGYWQISCNMYFYRDGTFEGYLHINKNYNHINTSNFAVNDAPTIFGQTTSSTSTSSLFVQAIIPITSITDYVNIGYYSYNGGMHSARRSLSIYRLGDI
jgi:hypothetical protein